MINYDKKIFNAISNSKNGEVDASIQFVYQQSGNIVTCSYAGGRILSGHLIGLVDENGCIDMRYHQVNTRSEMMTGLCRSTPEIMPGGKVRLHEKWKWTSGDHSQGDSVLEEQ